MWLFTISNADSYQLNVLVAIGIIVAAVLIVAIQMRARIAPQGDRVTNPGKITLDS